MENRLKAIYDAASALFINKGYVRTQIKDIAQTIGLSTGMLYVYFKGKKELLEFVLRCTVDPGYMERDFEYPITEREFAGLYDEIIAVLEESSRKFSEHLAGRAEDYPFPQMLSDAFDIIARYGTGCLILEKNIHDLGELAEQYQAYRKKFFCQLTGYVNLYQSSGLIRTVKYPELTAQLIIETLAWWGMHVMNDAFETHKNISLSVAKEVCLDNLINAYQAG